MVERLIDMLAQLTPLTGRLPLSCRPLSSVGQPSYYADRPYADRPYADRPYAGTAVADCPCCTAGGWVARRGSLGAQLANIACSVVLCM
jgi:hypothetical protein